MFCYRSSSLTVIHIFICARRWKQKFHCFPHNVNVCQIASVVSDSLWPHRLQPPGSSVHEILQARTLEWVSVPSSGDLPDPEIEPASLLSPALADRFFTTSATWEAPTMWINNAKKWSDTQMQETFITCVFHSKFNSEDANQASLDNL